MPDIKLRDEEYETLLKLVYLGNWLVNSPRKVPVRKYQALKRYLFSLAGKSAAARLVEYSRECMEFVPSPELENDKHIKKFIDYYDEAVFWDELESRLSKRDLENEFGVKLSGMDRKTLADKEFREVDKYSREFAKHGIRHLHLAPGPRHKNHRRS